MAFPPRTLDHPTDNAFIHRHKVLPCTDPNPALHDTTTDNRMKRQLELEAKETLLLSIHRVIASVLPTMTMDAILDNVSQALLHAGILRSLMIAIVNRAANTIDVVASVALVKSPTSSH